MRDLKIRLENQPGALARMGEALGKVGVSIEGGGGFVVGGEAWFHFLFDDGTKARAALEAAGIQVEAEREVIVQRLRQEEPGQLGKLAGRMAEAGVNIEVVYSDHANQLILGVDDLGKGRAVSAAWASAPEPRREHRYQTTVRWTGNTGKGTETYRSYERAHEIAAQGKEAIAGSSDPHFRGEPTRWNPEELLLAALSACHQLAYLHLCADAGLVVTDYQDDAEGVMTENRDGSGQFKGVVLRPRVVLAGSGDSALARSLHARAHSMCFIGRSVNFPVQVEPTIAFGARDLGEVSGPTPGTGESP